MDSHQSYQRDYDDHELYYRIKAVYSNDHDSILIMIYDHSFEKRFEELLTFQQQMESVSHIAAGVAHELRNPLSVIKGFLQLADLTKSFSKYYDTILSELNRMNAIIEDFLSVSRKRIEQKIQSPHGIMKSLFYIVKSECTLHNVSFDYNLDETTAQVHVNESMIKQVILNILRNAIEAFEDEKNRYLNINTNVSKSFYYIIIEDNGPGMDERLLENIDKPFFTTKEKGTGIGIPLCKKIIEDHGGSFSVKSELNVGTKVTISLPIVGEKNC
ncbi:GHKL domain-containing protein [Desertibacillus haloalkaliphilus]|nr:GHKL domain-containing protein [Desertibacillus haloalkaliphilus]